MSLLSAPGVLSETAMFGAGFLSNPDLFPARRGGETWGTREILLTLPGGPYRFTGLNKAQEEAVRHRFGAYCSTWDPLESTCRHASLSIL